MASEFQQAYRDRTVERPARVKDRKWLAFTRHVYGGETYGAIGVDLGITSGRVRDYVLAVDRMIRHADDTTPCPHCGGSGRVPRNPAA
jgi:hypothetical protein